MTIAAFSEKLEELISSEDILSVHREVKELRAKFEDVLLEEERLLQVAQLEAKEKGEAIPEKPELQQLKDAFHSLLSSYNVKRKKALEIKNSEEAENLSKKRTLIKRLEDTVQNEENIGAAFGAFKEIQESWKNVGDIPRDKRSSIQKEYSKLLEDFFYNINIYKEIKAHDFHRNSQLKSAVIEKLHALEKIEKIKEVEKELKKLQNDWEDIGPVSNEEWEDLKEKYWTTVRGIYDRINAFYDDRREQLQENLTKKKELLATTTAFIESLPNEMNKKTWQTKTKEILNFQEDWKKIGFGPKKENEAIWKEFRAQCDIFFTRKKEFFGELHQEYDGIAEKKKKLIEKVDALKDSTDWKETANKIIGFQKEWKKLGHAGKKHEQKLWKQFRASCDAFFQSRDSHFAEQDKAFEENLQKKQALIAKLERFKPTGKQEEDVQALQQFSSDFAAIGMVPRKDKDAIYKHFQSALDKQYAALDVDAEEKEKMLFQAKIESIAGSPNAAQIFRKEKDKLRKEIERIKQDVSQLENNLGFFANSKGADKLKQEVEQKVQKAKDKIDGIIGKIKSIPNE